MEKYREHNFSVVGDSMQYKFQVSLDNLHRQIAHPESNAGQSKVESLKRTIKS